MENIKAFIYGQIDNGTGILASVPQGHNEPSRFDPRSPIETGFCASGMNDDYYIVWRGESDNIYAVAIHNHIDSRGGYLLAAICTGDSLITNGERLLSVLRNIKEQIIRKYNTLSKDKIVELLQSEVSRIKDEDLKPGKIGTDDTNMQDCVRTYEEKEDFAELRELLENVDQDAYRNYKRVWFVKPTQCKDNSPFERITAPLVKTYTVLSPSNSRITVAAKTVKTGGQITITYKREKYSSKTIYLALDKQEYFTIDGYTIKLNEEKIEEKMSKEITQKINIKAGEKNLTIEKIGVDGEWKKDGKSLDFHNGVEYINLNISPKDIGLNSKEININGRSQIIYTEGDTNILYELATPKKNKDGKWKKIAISLMIFIAGALLTWGFLTFNGKETSQPKSSSDTTLVEIVINDGDEIQKQKDDEDYLKKEDKWYKDAIKSEKYKDFISMLVDKDGKVDIKYLKETYPVDTAHNGYWNKVIEDKDAEKYIRKNKDSNIAPGTINLLAIYLEIEKEKRQKSNAEPQSVATLKTAVKEPQSETPNDGMDEIDK